MNNDNTKLRGIKQALGYPTISGYYVYIFMLNPGSGYLSPALCGSMDLIDIYCKLQIRAHLFKQ